jgi:hypothetical protein
MKIPLSLIAALAAFSFSMETAAQARVRGMISAVDEKGFVIDGKTQVRLGEKTEIVFLQPIALAEIKPGDFLGVTSMKRADGTLTALEVRRFPKPLNPGHRPFDGRDDQTMTNATVSATVQSTAGRELTMSYAGGTQKIVVPASASVSSQVPGTRAHLVPGAPVNLTHDASGVVLRAQVGPKQN